VEAEGERDWLAEGLTEDEGEIDTLAEGERLGEAELEILAEGLREALGDMEAEGERETEKLCILISQFSLTSPVTFLYSNISPNTLPAG
jgi:hypothetical protein